MHLTPFFTFLFLIFAYLIELGSTNSDIIVNEHKQEDQSRPGVAVLNNGNVVFVWRSELPSQVGNIVLYRVYSSEG